MKKADLKEKVNTYKAETHNALQEVYDALNQGQRKKILKNEKINTLLKRYNVQTEG